MERNKGRKESHSLWPLFFDIYNSHPSISIVESS